jgi:hypothetical protein
MEGQNDVYEKSKNALPRGAKRVAAKTEIQRHGFAAELN